MGRYMYVMRQVCMVWTDIYEYGGVGSDYDFLLGQFGLVLLADSQVLEVLELLLLDVFQSGFIFVEAVLDLLALLQLVPLALLLLILRENDLLPEFLGMEQSHFLPAIIR